ncbi:hypothetical protein [Eubacterium ruminantium]|jgi:hypothetical protein|uniref:hypothetical protein n=1 Tax=Eubacterium ruminantium TaxID=42322 RepID=UPI00115FB4C0|nr:hypothetical protein [Eubacterium ruminantium]
MPVAGYNKQETVWYDYRRLNVINRKQVATVVIRSINKQETVWIIAGGQTVASLNYKTDITSG